MAKFKVGQVVAKNPMISTNATYHRISGIGKNPYYNGDVFFLDGETAEAENGFYFPYMLRKLTAREAGR